MPVKQCPFLNAPCIKGRCQLWKDRDCSIPQIIDGLNDLFDRIDDVREAIEKDKFSNLLSANIK